MNGVNYLIQTNLYLLLFMGFYVLVLRNETFFRQNRFFLNTSIFLSFVIPFMNSDWFRDLFITQKVREAAIMPSQMIYETIVVGANEEASALTPSQIIFIVYASGAMFLLIRFLLRLAFLRSKLKLEKGAAFSFFNTMVVDKEMPKAETIIDHEKVHMRQWHSADIIFIELAAIINWFNPVMYLYKKEIRHIHEFIADEEAATLMQSKSDYALLLFSNTLGVDPLHLSNNFFNRSLLKRRIVMLHKTKSRRTGLWKYGFSAPLFMLMLIVSAATVQSEEVIIKPMAETILSPLPAETSSNLIASLDLKKTVPGEIKTAEEFSAVAISRGSESGKIAPDFTTLKRHFMRTLKYPAVARQNNIIGFVVATFTIQNKEITGANVVRGLQTDVNGEVLRTLTSFRDQIDVPDDTYTVAIKYYLAGINNTTIGEFVPGQDIKNYIGQIIVTAMAPSAGGQSGKSPLDVPAADLSQFPGGLAGWNDYIYKNIRYPAAAREANIQGQVLLSFVVGIDGSVEEVNILRDSGGGTGEEAKRVMEASPKWKPIIKDGVPVRVTYTMPIHFALTSTPGASESVRDFASVDLLPEFAGGMAGWSRYLQANLKYPEEARKAKITGRVVMGFVVEKDGSISDIKVVRGVGSGLDEEAVRVLSNTPKWKPGIDNGRPVRVAYTMPIFFQLGSEPDKK